MRAKLKDKDVGIEMFLMGISLFGLFILFFALITSSADPLVRSGVDGFVLSIVKDGHMTTEEIRLLRSIDCDEIQMALGEGNKGCIYFKDSSGNIVDLSGDGSFGFGCPGLSINGTRICNY